MYDTTLGFVIPIVKGNNNLQYYQKIDNKKLYKSIIKYKERLKKSKYGNIRIPPFIQMCFWIIANKYSYNNKFINYSFRKDMITEAFLICCKYVNTFNPEKSDNPYSYFNQAIHNSFLQTILKEKKQSYIKDECMRMEIERRVGYGKKLGEKKKDMEDRLWE